MKLIRAAVAAALLAISGAVFYHSATAQVIGSGIRVNPQTGTTYTFLCTPPDNGKLVTFRNAASVAVTLPRASTQCFSTGWYVYVANAGVGAVTITPTTSQIASAASGILTTGSGWMIISDGTNYQVIK